MTLTSLLQLVKTPARRQMADADSCCHCGVLISFSSESLLRCASPGQIPTCTLRLQIPACTLRLPPTLPVMSSNASSSLQSFASVPTARQARAAATTDSSAA